MNVTRPVSSSARLAPLLSLDPPPSWMTTAFGVMHGR